MSYCLVLHGNDITPGYNFMCTSVQIKNVSLIYHFINRAPIYNQTEILNGIDVVGLLLYSKVSCDICKARWTGVLFIVS